VQRIPIFRREAFAHSELLVIPETRIAPGGRMNGIPKTGQSAPQLFRLARARSAGFEMAKDVFVTSAKHPLSNLIFTKMVVHRPCLPYFALLFVMLSKGSPTAVNAQNDSSGRDPCHAERSEASRQFVML
jgi:hypothetical protein